jgi:hypothetical protein
VHNSNPLVGMADDLWTSKSGSSGALNLEEWAESRAMWFGVCLFGGVSVVPGWPVVCDVPAIGEQRTRSH